MKVSQANQGEFSFWRRPWIRALALLLVVTLLAGIYLGSISSIDVRRTGKGDLNDTVTGYLMDNTEYVNQSAWERVKAALLAGAIQPKTYEDYDRLASTHFSHGEYAQALPYLIKCIELSDGTTAEKTQLWLKRACLETLTGDNDAAMRSLDALAQMEGAPAEAHLLRAQLLSVRGDNLAAEEPLAAYVRLCPDDLQMRASLAELAYANGHYETAEQSYAALLAHPESPYLSADAYLKRASCLLTLGRYQEGLADCESYLALGNPPDDTLLALRGSLAIGAGNIALAASDLAAAGDAGRQDCYEQAALCAYQAGEYALCIRCAKCALEASAANDAAGLYQAAGLAHLSLKEYGAAREEFTLALETDPTAYEGLYYRGVACMASDQLDEAIHDFTAAIRADAQTQSSHYNRAVCYLSKDRLSDAYTDLLLAQRGSDQSVSQMASELLISLEESLKESQMENLPAPTDGAGALSSQNCEKTNFRYCILSGGMLQSTLRL